MEDILPKIALGMDAAFFSPSGASWLVYIAAGQVLK